MYSSKAKPGTTFKLLCLVVVANVFVCDADYTLQTKAHQTTRISMVLSPAFARKRGCGKENSDYFGFIPELLKSLKERKGLGDYVIVRATDDVIGEQLPNRNWTGLMLDVIQGNRKVIGAGPILNNKTYENDVKFSTPWATVYLTLVVKRISNVTTLTEALDRQWTILAVRNSPELAEVQNKGSEDSMHLFSNLLRRLKVNKNNRFVDTAQEGLQHVEREERYGLLMNSEEARYYVTHEFCSLTAVENFHEMGNYVFLLDPEDMALNKLNEELKRMKKENFLDKLRDKELGIPGTCSKGSVLIRPKEGIVTMLFAVATVISARILS